MNLLQGLTHGLESEIRELMVELSHMGKTIFFSTHILADVAEICTRVGIIEDGKLVASGTLEELHLQVIPRRRVEVTLLNQLEQAQHILSDIAGVDALRIQPAQNGDERNYLDFEFNGDDLALSTVLTCLVHAQIPVLHFSEKDIDLEEVFLRTTQGIVS